MWCPFLGSALLYPLHNAASAALRVTKGQTVTLSVTEPRRRRILHAPLRPLPRHRLFRSSDARIQLQGTPGTCPPKSSSVDLTNSSPTSSGREAGDVRPRCPHAKNQPRDGLPRRVPHRRDSLARKRQVNVRVVPTGKAIEESVDLAYEIYNRVFRKVPDGL
jgi:hypothetical protein